MRAIILSGLLLPAVISADQFVYVRDGRVASAPRALPSVGVSQDTGFAILGLHGASDAVRAACGWYRVIPSATQPASNQVVSSRSYVIGKGAVQEVLTLRTRITRTPQQRIEAALSAMPGATDDERVTALVRAVAAAVTSRLDKAVTVTIPAKSVAIEEVIRK